ncbi:hypothetical protein FRB90_012610 [Tulasnella sp. 427]|nr:hypothetical protein FRB90_012610 [Tulasnella sp. 427]
MPKAASSPRQNRSSPTKPKAAKPKLSHSEQIEKDWAEVEVKPEILPLLTRLGQATSEELQVARADEVKAIVGKSRTFDIDLRWFLIDQCQGMFKEAVKSREKLLRAVIDVLATWNPIIKAADVLLELDRPKKFGDGKRAFQILAVIVREVYEISKSFQTKRSAAWALGGYVRPRTYYEDYPNTGLWREVIVAIRESKLSDEEVKAIEEEKRLSLEEFVAITAEPLEKASRKARAEAGPRNVGLRQTANKLGDLLQEAWISQACRDEKYDDGNSFGMKDGQFGAWEGAIDELDAWGSNE